MKRLKNIIAVVAVFAGLFCVSAWGEQPGSWQAQKEKAMRQGERAKAQKEARAKKAETHEALIIGDEVRAEHLDDVAVRLSLRELKISDNRMDSIFKEHLWTSNGFNEDPDSLFYWDVSMSRRVDDPDRFGVGFNLLRKEYYRYDSAPIGYYQEGRMIFLIPKEMSSYFTPVSDELHDISFKYQLYGYKQKPKPTDRTGGPEPLHYGYVL